MPAVNGGIKLHSRVCAFPCGMSQLAIKIASANGSDRGPVHPPNEIPVGVVQDGLHEFVGHPDRVIGVLVLDGKGVRTVEVHVEPGVARPRA